MSKQWKWMVSSSKKRQKNTINHIFKGPSAIACCNFQKYADLFRELAQRGNFKVVFVFSEVYAL